jgi:hypothetical protein
MVYSWATRSVAITALVLRTCVDLQAAIASAILASLLLESQSGIHLYQTASMSTMRTGSVSPWTFALCVLEEFWRSTAKSRRNYHVYAMATCLLITTSVVQFSSTLLLSDLELGPLKGIVVPSKVRPSMLFCVDSPQRIARDSAWTTDPLNYATFGEYHEQPSETAEGIADTGILLRAFLPYAAAGSRQRLATYTGNALTIDARVACQAPSITDLDVQGFNGQIAGIVSPTTNATILQSIIPTSFNCTIAGPDQITICQLGQSSEDFMGSLKSQFEKSTAYGTAFLVIDGSRLAVMGKEWLTIKAGSSWTNEISLSLCFAPWDAAILNVTLHSELNRTEPVLRYWGGFQPSKVLTHLIPIIENRTRQIMTMEKPHSFLGDLPPPYRRPVVQSDMGGSSAGLMGAIAPLPGNWSVFLTGIPLATHLRIFDSPPTKVISADPALAAIFTEAIEAGYSVAWALSSLITVLSMTNYYSQQAAFDRVDTVSVSFFQDVLYPRDYTGLNILMWTLAAHFLLLTMLVMLFVTKTRLTLLGNAWSALAQVAEGQEVSIYIAGASLMDDSTLLERMRVSGEGELRARLVSKGDGAEIKVG